MNIEHGTVRGYQQHRQIALKSGGPINACDACLAAHRAYNKKHDAQIVPCPECESGVKRRAQLRCDACNVRVREDRKIQSAARREAERERRAAERAPKCGTDSGYYYHLRKWKTVPCEPCTAAHAAANRRRTAARTGRTIEPKAIRPRPKRRQTSERTDLRWTRDGLVLRVAS